MDLLVIGGGSGGIATARRAAAYGARVTLVERGRLGGTCVNVGCVPKKLMWHAAELAGALADAPDYGFSFGEVRHDWSALVRRRRAYVERLNGIYADNLAADGVERITGEAVFVGPRRVRVGDRLLQAEHVLIATGGVPMRPPIPGAELGIDSDGFFELDHCPRRVAVAGSGYIAVELAGVLNALGAEVSLLLRRDSVLREFDAMLGESVLEAYRAQGIAVHCRTEVRAVSDENGQRRLRLSTGEELHVDTLLWAIGRAPATAGLGLDAAGVACDERGFVITDEWQQTTAGGVFAVGDVTGQVALTPVAIAAGRRLAERLYGGQADRLMDYRNVPSVVFAHPAVGSVGLSEAAARAAHGDAVRVYQSQFRALYNGVLDESRKQISRMKLVCVGEDERVVGVHLFGPASDEILQGFAVAVRMGATKRDLDDTVAIHPTCAEELVTMK